MYAKLLLVSKAAAKSAVESARFVKEFKASDWTAGDTLSIPASEHGQGTQPAADVWRLDGTSYTKREGYPSDGWSLTVDASGNLTLSTGAGSAFAGRIIVL